MKRSREEQLADARVILDVLGPPTETRVEPTIAALLSASRTAHRQYIRLSGLWSRDPGNTDPVQAIVEFRRAAQLRAYAELLDPSHSDPAWIEEVETNQNFENGPLLYHYREQLTTVPAA